MDDDQSVCDPGYECCPGYRATIRELRAVNADMLAALEAAREELRLIHMKDRNTVYQPGLGVMIDMAIRRAKGEG